jgi:hypothetical protein
LSFNFVISRGKVAYYKKSNYNLPKIIQKQYKNLLNLP